MASTITTGKTSAAFYRADGTVVYALFERTYESNVFPHTPRWSCIALGEYADVMRRIFDCAAACEGGVLQGSGRRQILPENYIASWRTELSNSVQMPDINISLRVGTGYRATIGEEHIEDVKEILVNMGREKLFAEIMEGQATISLHQDVAVIIALYGVDKIFPPWLILDHRELRTVPNKDFAPQPVVNTIALPDVELYRADSNSLVGRIGNEVLHSLGWDYAAVGRFVREVAYPLEMKKTGSAKQVISDFREACANAKPLPATTKVKVTRNISGLDKWYSDYADQVARMLGIVGETDIAPSTFEFFFSEAISKDAVFRLLSLKQDQVEWNVPAEKVISSGSAVQLELLQHAA